MLVLATMELTAHGMHAYEMHAYGIYAGKREARCERHSQKRYAPAGYACYEALFGLLSLGDTEFYLIGCNSAVTVTQVSHEAAREKPCTK
jgi:hypothetical protein